MLVKGLFWRSVSDYLLNQLSHTYLGMCCLHLLITYMINVAFEKRFPFAVPPLGLAVAIDGVV